MLQALRRIRLFYDKKIDYYAASLSFFTLFAFVPILLILLYFSSMIGLLEEIHHNFVSLFGVFIPNYSAVNVYLESFIKIDSSIGFTGMFYVVVVSVVFLRDYQQVICKVLKVKMMQMQVLSFYINHLVFIPSLIFLYFYTYEFFHLNFVYHPIMFFIFFIAYLFAIPNAKMNFWLLVRISIVVSFLWELVKNFYIFYTVYNKAYITLYGSLSAVFFLLLWVYISWILYLYGLKYYHLRSATS